MLGRLPLEEMVFFFMTNLIIGLGMTLMLSSTSRKRLIEWRERYFRKNRVQTWLAQARQDRLALVWLGSLLLWLGFLIATPIAVWVLGEEVFPLMATLGVLAQC
jgi:hypothetical protein